VNHIVLNRALGGLEIDLPDLGNRGLGINRPLLDRLQRDESERSISHSRCGPALLFLRNNPRISSTGRVFSTASGVSHARRATWMPQRMLPSATHRMRIGRNRNHRAALVRGPCKGVAQVKAVRAGN
jgi:hypothetical protein